MSIGFSAGVEAAAGKKQIGKTRAVMSPTTNIRVIEFRTEIVTRPILICELA
jgi:hypothetical protein